MRYTPHDYQAYSIDLLLEHPAAGLFLKPGMGKTSIALTAASQILYDRFEASKVLVVAPLRVAEDTCMHKCSFPLPENASAVLDLGCLITDISVHSESGAAIAVFSLLYCMFTCGEQGEISYSEQAEECEYRIPVDEGEGTLCFSPRAAVLSVSFSMSGTASLECRCEISVGGCIYSLLRPKAALGISCDTEKPKERNRDASLVIYYAAGGEDVWEIAKRYNTSLQAVMEENALEQTTLQEKRMLLIPIV